MEGYCNVKSCYNDGFKSRTGPDRIVQLDWVNWEPIINLVFYT